MWQSNTENPEKLATQGTQDDEKQNKNTTQNVLDTLHKHKYVSKTNNLIAWFSFIILFIGIVWDMKEKQFMQIQLRGFIFILFKQLFFPWYYYIDINNLNYRRHEIHIIKMLIINKKNNETNNYLALEKFDGSVINFCMWISKFQKQN